MQAQIKEVNLKVMEALQEEAYKGIVRIDSETMHNINVHPGDVVEIEGNRITSGIVDRAYPTDVGQKVIRMDGILRKNAKTGIGEIVRVRKAQVTEAKSITIAPAQENLMIETTNPEFFKRAILGRAVVKGDIISLGGTTRRKKTMAGSPYEDIFNLFEENFIGNFNFNLMGIKFIVVNTIPKGITVITESTQLTLNPKAVEVLEEKVPEVTYEDIGGLEEEIRKIREMVELPLKHPEIFERVGIQPPKGVLLHGYPGTGKTLLAKAVANESDAHFILINGPEIMNKFVGEAEKRIRDIFDDAEKNAPSIIFIDEIDAIAPKREESYGEVERRVVAQLLATMDGLKSRGKVVVIAASNRPNSIDPALRRPGRFDREIEIGVPGKNGRLSILKIHTRNMPLTPDVKLDKLADITHGFVGADLEALCKEAAMSVIRKVLPDLKLKKDDGAVPQEVLEKLKIMDQDFRDSLKVVRPSAMREVLVEVPNVRWKDIGGLEDIKQQLKEAVEWPIKNPQAFKRLGIRPPRGILLYGPPGTGKTLLAKAIATESEANFILVKGPELINKFVGESERAIRKVFERARQTAPCIIFFDELDSIASARGRDMSTSVTDKVTNQILSEMDGIVELNDVIVVGATNRPDILDPALLRPGRFDRIIATTVPTKRSRLEIFKIHSKTMPLAKDVNFTKLIELTENFVGADIEGLCREAAILALREDFKAKEIKMKHFLEVLKKVKSSVSEVDIKKYKEIEDQYMGTARAAEIRKKEVQPYFG